MIISDANSCVNDNTSQELSQPQNKERLGYVYRHIRLDTNMPFYIGIGSMDNGKYERAFSKDRNNIWLKIYKKTDYRVEILWKNIPYDLAKEKEKYFIKLYGRIDLKTGTLANLTDGGEGTWGLIVTEGTRKKISIASLGRVHTEEAKKKMSISNMGKNKGRKHTKETIEKLKKIQVDNSIPVKLYDYYKNLIKEYPNISIIKSDGFDPSRLINIVNGKRTDNLKGFKFELKDGVVYGYQQSADSHVIKNKKVPVILLNKNDNVINTFSSLNNIQKSGFLRSGIGKCLRQEAEHYLGYNFYYNEDNTTIYGKLIYENIKKKIVDYGYKVTLFDACGNILKEYEKISLANKDLFTTTRILDCANGCTKKYKGYKFIFFGNEIHGFQVK